MYHANKRVLCKIKSTPEVPCKDDCDAADFLPDFPPSHTGSR